MSIVSVCPGRFLNIRWIVLNARNSVNNGRFCSKKTPEQHYYITANEENSFDSTDCPNNVFIENVPILSVYLYVAVVMQSLQFKTQLICLFNLHTVATNICTLCIIVVTSITQPFIFIFFFLKLFRLVWHISLWNSLCLKFIRLIWTKMKQQTVKSQVLNRIVLKLQIRIHFEKYLI